jgi:hypothetical protein
MRRSPQLDQLIASSTEYLLACQDRISSEFSLGKWPRYDLYQERRELVFSEDGHPRVIAEIQLVGSISTRSNTWLWSWANDSIDGSLTVAASTVRLYGEEHGFSHLTTSKWDADETDGWGMTAITAFLTSAKGVYRSPWEGGLTFAVMTRIGWAT